MNETTSHGFRLGGWLKVLVAGGLGVALAAGGLAWAAQYGHGPLAAGGRGHFRERFARLHVEMVTDRALRVAGATKEQREQVDAILEKAFADHARFRAQHEALRGEVIEALSADTIDRARLDAIRAKHLKIAEEGSRHLVTVLADIAEVLTPEQRRRLAAHAPRMLE